MLVTTATIELFLDAIVVADPPFSDDVRVMLVKEPFTPNLGLALGDLTPTNFDGYVEKGPETVEWGNDPNTSYPVITLTPPAGGWHWETASTDDLPQTIYGWAVYDGATSVMLGSELFDDPPSLDAANQIVDIPSVTITLLPNALI